MPGLIAAMTGANQTIAQKRKTFDLTGDTAGIVAISPKGGSRSQGSLRYAGGAFHAAPDRAGDVLLRVFTADGALVSTLSGKAPETGALSLPWSGAPAPGMYLVSMRAGGQDQGRPPRDGRRLALIARKGASRYREVRLEMKMKRAAAAAALFRSCQNLNRPRGPARHDGGEIRSP